MNETMLYFDQRRMEDKHDKRKFLNRFQGKADMKSLKSTFFQPLLTSLTENFHQNELNRSSFNIISVYLSGTFQFIFRRERDEEEKNEMKMRKEEKQWR